MGTLIRSEFRKVFSVKLWWALLIPAVLVTFFLAWFGSFVTFNVFVRPSDGAPLGLITFASGINFSTIFAMLVGGLAFAGEFHHKTITTTYLTAGSRLNVLYAKVIVYAALGALYGIACALFASLGSLAGAGVEGFPNLLSWLSIAGIGILANALWAMLGVGVGALIKNQLGVVVLVPFSILIERIVLGGIFNQINAKEISYYMPHASGSQMIDGLMRELFMAELPERLLDRVPSSTLLSAGPAWWASGLVLVGYVALFIALGYAVGKKRDIT